MKEKSYDDFILDLVSYAAYSASINRRISADTVTEMPIGPDKDVFNAAQRWFGYNDELESVSIPYTAADGGSYNHFGYYLHNNSGSNKAVLVCHGYTGCSHSTGAMAKIYYDAGFSVLSVDLRGHGRSDEERTNVGIIDSKDMLTWVDFLIKKTSPDVGILVHGCSLGCGVALQLISDEALPDNVNGAIVDSSYQNTAEVVSDMISALLFPFPPESKQYIYSSIDKLLFKDQGIKFEDGLSLPMIQKGKVPLLMIHSKDDGSFSIDNARETFDVYPDNHKGYMWIANAPHAFCAFYYYSGYQSIINDFIASLYESRPLLSGCYEKMQSTYEIGKEINLAEDIVATDLVDGDISGNVVITGTVDNSVAGVYPVSYHVTNSSGNDATVTIDIVVR